MIAITTLLDVKGQVEQRNGIRRKVRCFFSEENSRTFSLLEDAVKRFHTPDNGFEVKTYFGKFEEAVNEIQMFIGPSFPLIFIDPTGWTGYPLEKDSTAFPASTMRSAYNFHVRFRESFHAQ